MDNNDVGLRFLKAVYKGDKTKNDLVEKYFGAKSVDVSVCIKRAYRDMCRVLSGISDEENAESYKEDVVNEISERIDDLLKLNNPNEVCNEKIEDFDLTEYDKWHYDVCEMIIEKSKEKLLNVSFNFGHAQKWINMTLKYMYIMRVKDFKKIENLLHVPVDSYIMEAASTILGVKIIREKNTGYGKYSESGSKRWSKWGFKEYFTFQSDIRKEEQCPIRWEGEAWLEISENRKRKEVERALKNIDILEGTDLMDNDQYQPLLDQWSKLLNNLNEFCFDSEEFKCLALNTHKFLIKYDFKVCIPSRLMQLLFLINNFYCSNIYIPPELEAAKIIGKAFIDRIQYSHGIVDNKNEFFVYLNDKKLSINTETFELEEIVESLEDC